MGLGVDFVFTTQTVSFATNEATASISIPINNDSLVEPTEKLTFTLANPQNGIIGITQNAATLEILDDNDTAGIIITSTGGADVAEGGTSDTYTVVLQSQPSNLVIIIVDPDTQTDLGAGTGVPLTLNFTPNNWNLPQTVRIKAGDDPVAEASPHTSAIAHKVTSTDPKYNQIATASLTTQITDNDTAGVTITPPNTTATEGGVTGSYKVALTSKPTAPVKVNCNTDIQIDSISTFTFTSANWNLPQTVTVTATDDCLVEGLHTGTIDHSVAGGSAAEYLPVAIAPVTVTIADNDTATSTAGVKFSLTTTYAAEGGANGSYSAVLTGQPSSDVTVSFATDSQIEAILSFTFTAANWNLPQTATVKATDDRWIATCGWAGPATTTLTVKLATTPSSAVRATTLLTGAKITT